MFCAVACLLAMDASAPALAQSGLTPDQANQMKTFLKQSGQIPTSPSASPAIPMADVVYGRVDKTTLASTSASAATATSDMSLATVNTRGRDSLLSILSLGAPEAVPSGITLGISSGQGVTPPLPVMASLEHQASQAIVVAFQQGPKTTAEQVATYAADTAPADPALEERMALARAVFQVDGTDAIIRHFVATEHMKLIITEVARHIDFSKLSESDKYRLSAIAAAAQTELEDKVINLNAGIQATNLSKPELLQLLAAYDTDAQRKLTNMRLNDDGKIDRSSELDIHLAQYQIVKAFESGQ